MFWGETTFNATKKACFVALLAAGLGGITPSHAQAADLDFGFSIQGPNGGFYIGENGVQFDNYNRHHGYARRPYRTERHWKHRDQYRPYAERNYENCGGITKMAPVRYRGYCEHPTQVYERLTYEGWHDFRGLRVQPRAFRVFARNANGEPYKLRIDRCTGEILHAKRKTAPYYRAGYW